MSVYGTASTTDAVTVAASTSGSQTSAQQLASNMDTFLTLLVAQLKNQDPLSPMDSAEFTNQLVQYSEVEQSITMNSNLEKLISLTNQNTATQALGYMGQTVQADTSYVPLQEGKAKFNYILESDAQTCMVTIADSSGAVVAAIPAEKTAGKHTMEWDGTDTNGNKLDDGSYKISITALSGGETVNSTVTVFGRVTGIANDGESIAIGMGDVVIDMSQILAVHETVKKTEEVGQKLKRLVHKNYETAK